MPPEENAGGNVIADTGTETAAAPAGQQPPEWLGNDAAKFWDAEKGIVDPQKIHGSYRELQSAFGRRLGEVSVETRRQLAEAVPEEMRSIWEQEIRAKLVEDPEFLTPLQEKWAEANKPTPPPESYATPEGITPDHPLVARAGELAKELGLSQDGFAKMLAIGAEIANPWERPLTPQELVEAFGKENADQRANIINNRVQTVCGEDGRALLGIIRQWDDTPAKAMALRAVEKMVQSQTTKPLALEPAQAPDQLTEAQLKQMMRDPKYHDPYKKDPEFHARVTAGWRRLYGDVIQP